MFQKLLTVISRSIVVIEKCKVCGTKIKTLCIPNIALKLKPALFYRSKRFKIKCYGCVK